MEAKEFTSTQFRIMGLLSQGRCIKDIARALGIKRASVDTAISRAMRIAQVGTSMQLIAKFERGELNE